MVASAQSGSPVKNVVLVHGAWADGSSWSKLIPLLQARGLHVVTVQNPLSSLADDVAATNRIIDAQDGPVLLVGHSYGGAIITEAGMNPKVAGLVYVAAFAPDIGESCGSMGKAYPPSPVGPEVRPIADGYLLLSAKGINEDFAQDLSVEERNTMVATQGATQGAALGTPVKNAAWHTKPTWFVIAANDRMISPDQEKDSAKRMGAKVITVSTSHVPMLSQPRKVADLVIEAAAAGGSIKAASN